MKRTVLWLVVVVIAGVSFGCKNRSASGEKKYRAKFEIAGICSNYTFSVVEGEIDTSFVAPKWTDETTGRTYKNAFAVKNPCLLPKGLKVGDTFSFVIDTNPPKNECVVCLAYYPVPPKSLDIKVVQ